MKLLRLGHPARLLPQVLDSSLEAHVMRSDNSSLAKDCRKCVACLFVGGGEVPCGAFFSRRE